MLKKKKKEKKKKPEFSSVTVEAKRWWKSGYQPLWVRPDKILHFISGLKKVFDKPQGKLSSKYSIWKESNNVS